jgi:hypothetical protein
MRRAIILAAVLAAGAAGAFDASPLLQFVTAQSWTPASLSPVAWYKGDGDTTDYGSARSNAVWYGGASYTNGINGQAWNLMGVSNYLFAGYTEAAAETIAFWVCPRNNTANRAAVTTRDAISGDNTPGTGIWFEHTAGNQSLYAQDDYRVPIAYTKNQWRHVAVTFASGTWTVYTNSAFAVSYSGTRRTGKIWLSFGSNGALNTFIDAALDDVLIFNRALTQSEITQLYNWRQ